MACHMSYTFSRWMPLARTALIQSRLNLSDSPCTWSQMMVTLHGSFNEMKCVDVVKPWIYLAVRFRGLWQMLYHFGSSNHSLVTAPKLDFLAVLDHCGFAIRMENGGGPENSRLMRWNKAKIRDQHLLRKIGLARIWGYTHQLFLLVVVTHCRDSIVRISWLRRSPCYKCPFQDTTGNKIFLTTPVITYPSWNIQGNGALCRQARFLVISGFALIWGFILWCQYLQKPRSYSTLNVESGLAWIGVTTKKINLQYNIRQPPSKLIRML